jgi:serine/threonine protein kinase
MDADQPLTTRREEDVRKLCPKVGEILGDRYRVEGIIGIGGMGVVLSATQLDLDRRVAVKVLVGDAARDRESVARLAREGRALSKLTTSHVSRLLDVGTIPSTGAPFLVMEYLEGQDLARALRAHGAFSVEKTVLLALEACEALDEAHAEGIVHRDIKPSNMFLCMTSGGCLELKLLDFGISKVSAALQSGDDDNKSLTRTSQLLGSPLYMSPEQLRATRDVDSRTDVWSLGVVLYELLSGRPPFDGDTVADVCARILVMSPPPLQGVPDALAAVVMRCLEKDPQQRFANVADLARALTPFSRCCVQQPTKAVLKIEKEEKKTEEEEEEEKLVVAPFFSRARALASAITIVAIGLGVCGALRKPHASAPVVVVTSPAAASPTIEVPPPMTKTPEPEPEPEPERATATSSTTQPSVVFSQKKPRPDFVKITKSNVVSASSEPDIGY